MKRITPLKLTCVGAFVAALGVGCASSGTAQYDASSDPSISVAASADTGTDQDVIVTSSTGTSAQMETGTVVVTESGALVATQPVEGEDRITVSALSFSPETRANWVNRFPFHEHNFRTIETYTFTPDEEVSMAEFTDAVRPGELYNEASGGSA